MKYTNYLVVGAGVFGAVVAERIASVLGQRVTVIDRRDHIGGNAYSSVDATTGIECHRYGAHIFHTSRRNVWDYIGRFSRFTSYQHKVFTQVCGRVYTMPINLKTLNDFYGLNLNPFEMGDFLTHEIAKSKITNPANLEEKAISLIGEPLYKAFIRGYTLKQWNQDPIHLSPEIITRLPVRYNYNNNYYSDPLQGLPDEGYSKLFENLLSHPNIDVQLNTSLASVRKYISNTCCVVYTGMIDELLDYRFGALGWRSLRFEWETKNITDYQGTSVMNYGDIDVPFTRIHEFKHFHPERCDVFSSGQTVICKEYSSDYKKGDDAYYPVNTAENQRVYLQYVAAFKRECPNWILGGRLGAYQYWDMDTAIEKALVTFKTDLLLG